MPLSTICLFEFPTVPTVAVFVSLYVTNGNRRCMRRLITMPLLLHYMLVCVITGLIPPVYTIVISVISRIYIYIGMRVKYILKCNYFTKKQYVKI
jgi:hypothetical protein